MMTIAELQAAGDPNGDTYHRTAAGYLVTDQDCARVNCGLTPPDPDIPALCSATMGNFGTWSCYDPRCVPFKEDLKMRCVFPSTNAVTAATAPPSPAVQANPQGSVQVLTPQMLIAPTPDITANPAPSPPAPSMWCSLNAWIGDNPLLAGAVLVAGYFLVVGKKGR